MNQFLSGAFALASIASGFFFIRYWKQSRDRTFLILAIAFYLLALERTVLSFIPPALDGRHWIYLARLLAFVLLIVGIIDKNRRHPRSAASSR
jgi:nitrate/nitrite transporter NarK